MGIFICAILSPSVTEAQWAPVYEESLRMAKALGLMELVSSTCHGVPLICYESAQERPHPLVDTPDLAGWDAIGDSYSMQIAEANFTPKQICYRSPQGEYIDPLMVLLLERRVLSGNNEWCRRFRYIWGGKTQGYPYHIMLLAIACMMETRLPGLVTVSGDITFDQCCQAVTLANCCTQPEVLLPVYCDMGRLLPRVQNLPLPESEKLRAFEALYFGAKDESFYTFIQEYFSSDQIDNYWKQRFSKHFVGDSEYQTTLMDFLDAGGTLQQLFQYTNFSQSYIPSYGEKDHTSYARFVRAILKAHLHVEKKEPRACLELEPETPGTSSMLNALMRISYCRARDPYVRVYLPLERIRETLSELLAGKCDVSAVIEAFLREEERKADPTLNNYTDQDLDRNQKPKKQYDITRWVQLLHYRTENTISPRMASMMHDTLKLYFDISAEPDCETLIQQGPAACFQYLCTYNRRFILRKSDMEHIYAVLHQKPESFHRYYPMARIQANRDTAYWVILAAAVNDEFYAYALRRKEMENA